MESPIFATVSFWTGSSVRMAHPVEEMGGGNCNTSEEERMEAVPVVVLDESFLFSGDGDGDNDGAVRFLPGVETLLRRFQFSQLRVVKKCEKLVFSMCIFIPEH